MAAIFQVDRLGDVVLASSAIRILLDHYGEAECLLVVSNIAAPLVAMEFPRTRTLVLPTVPGTLRNTLRVWRQFRSHFKGFSARHTFCLSHQRDIYKQTALSWIKTERQHELDRHTYPKTYRPGLCFELEAHMHLLGSILERPISPAEILPALTSTQPTDGNNLLVCPRSSSWLKELPDDILLEALGLWRARSRAPVTFCGTESQAPALQQLADAMNTKGQGLANIVTPASIPAFVGEVAHAGAVLTVDSAPLHIATALDKRTIVIGGGGNYGLCFPWQRSERQQTVTHRLTCFGCGWQCHYPKRHCLTDFDAAKLAAAIPSL